MTKKAYSDWQSHKDMTGVIITSGLPFRSLVCAIPGAYITYFPSIGISDGDVHFEFKGEYVLIQKSYYYAYVHRKDITSITYYSLDRLHAKSRLLRRLRAIKTNFE